MTTLDVFFEYLNEQAKKELCDFWKTLPQHETWEIIPLTTIIYSDEIDGDKWVKQMSKKE